MTTSCHGQVICLVTASIHKAMCPTASASNQKTNEKDHLLYDYGGVRRYVCSHLGYRTVQDQTQDFAS